MLNPMPVVAFQYIINSPMTKIRVQFSGETLEQTFQNTIAYSDFLKLIENRFGSIKDLSRKISYVHTDEVCFVNDDDDLHTALKNFPQGLEVVIRQEQDPFYLEYCSVWDKMQSHQKEQIPTISENAQFWQQKSTTHHQVQLNHGVLSGIEGRWSGRVGHSDDHIASFLMSAFAKRAAEGNQTHQTMDKTIWKLEEWKNHNLQKIHQKDQYTLPALTLPTLIHKKTVNSSECSYLFSNPCQNVPKIQSQVGEGKGGLQLSTQHSKYAQHYTDHIRYYIHDLTNHLLSESSSQKPNSTVIDGILAAIRKFSKADKDYAEEVMKAWTEYHGKGPYYIAPGDDDGMVPDFDDEDVIGVVGDWGTNLQDSYDLLDELVLRRNATVILHTGDVYYAGFPEEYKKVSEKLRKLQGERKNLRFYTIPGNHDYYSFGKPFYDSLAENHIDEASNQKLALFCLRNKSSTLQFLGLNTGRYDKTDVAPWDTFQGTRLVEKELEWALKKINSFKGRTVLITHHPMFSVSLQSLGPQTEMGGRNPQINPNLAQQLFEVLPKLTCWFWGHEHRFRTYQSNSFGINRAVLIGASAMPINDPAYYNVKYSNGGINVDRYLPQVGESQTDKGWYNNTAIVLSDFASKQSIKAKYIYMTSSSTLQSKLLRELEDEYLTPKQTEIETNHAYQLLHQLGLNLAITDRVWLDSTPTDIQILDPKDQTLNRKVNQGQEILIKAADSSKYLQFNGEEVTFGNFETSQEQEKTAFLWRIEKTGNQWSSTGDVFHLRNVAKDTKVGSVYVPEAKEYRLNGVTASRFQLYKRQQ